MRACPTCECFVPEAARRCPRCDATLEPVREPANAHRESVLVGMARHGSARFGNEPVSPVVARLTLPPIDGPATRPRREGLPKLPQPYAPDPLVRAVVLGISPDEKTEPEPEPEPERETDEALAAAGETFAALLGTPLPSAPAPVAPAPTVGEPANVASTPLAVPIVAAKPELPAPTPTRRSRYTQRDPFVRSTTRRERVLTRLCFTLAFALALSVIVLRLPLGARPELGASSPVATVPAPSPPAVAISPSPSAGSAQPHADLQKVMTTARQLQHQWHTYALANDALLGRAFPKLSFIARTAISKRIGEVSVATSMHVFVVAEYAGPGLCTFARVVDRHTATIVGPTAATCSAAVTPLRGWTTLPA